MAELKTYTCDICGVTKNEANHWFRAFKDSGDFLIMRWNSSRRFQQMQNSVDPEIHLCSENCAAKAMSKVIGSGK